jgi:hypothetical protein
MLLTLNVLNIYYPNLDTGGTFAACSPEGD